MEKGIGLDRGTSAIMFLKRPEAWPSFWSERSDIRIDCLLAPALLLLPPPAMVYLLVILRLLLLPVRASIVMGAITPTFGSSPR